MPRSGPSAEHTGSSPRTSLAHCAHPGDVAHGLSQLEDDHFKRLNDAHGHPTGDAVLRWVGGWLQRSFRSTDLVSRYEGEEFVVAFVDTDEIESLVDRLESLRAGIEHTTLRTLGADAEIHVTVSIGIAHMPRDGSDAEEVLARADARLYEAKGAGRNQIVAGPSPA